MELDSRAKIICPDWALFLIYDNESNRTNAEIKFIKRHVTPQAIYDDHKVFFCIN